MKFDWRRQNGKATLWKEKNKSENLPLVSLQHCLDGRCVAAHENIIPDYSQQTANYANYQQQLKLVQTFFKHLFLPRKKHNLLK